MGLKRGFISGDSKIGIQKSRLKKYGHYKYRFKKINVRNNKMSRPILLLLLLVVISPANADKGIINVSSAHNIEVTTNQLVTALKEKGMTIYNQIDHAQNAKAIGAELRPTQLVIFGNPRAGTPLMQCAQLSGLDLPQKALIWEDAKGAVWFSYNDPAYLAQRHQLIGCEKNIEKISTILASFAAVATQK
jgi:uncharacterized protein (DUF302 family)